MRSSYIQNNFGEVLKQYVMAYEPTILVELGLLDGYSTLHIAQGLKWVEKRRGKRAVLDAYDIFDDYAFKHGKKEEIERVLSTDGVSDYARIIKGNAYEVHQKYPDMVLDSVPGIDFLHIDISNTGSTVHNLIKLWHPKIAQKGFIFIEGGSNERDQVEWMEKFNMPSIKEELESNHIINRYYIWGTYFDFPGLTVAMRKWWDVDKRSS